MAVELRDFLRRQIDVLAQSDPYKPFAESMHGVVAAYIDVQTIAQHEVTPKPEQSEVVFQEAVVVRSPREIAHINLGRKLQGYFGQFEDETKLDDILQALHFKSMDPRWESLLRDLNSDEREIVSKATHGLFRISRLNEDGPQAAITLGLPDTSTIGGIRQLSHVALERSRIKGIGHLTALTITEALKKGGGEVFSSQSVIIEEETEKSRTLGRRIGELIFDRVPDDQLLRDVVPQSPHKHYYDFSKGAPFDERWGPLWADLEGGERSAISQAFHILLGYRYASKEWNFDKMDLDTIGNLRQLTVDDFTKIPGIGRNRAVFLYEAFRRPKLETGMPQQPLSRRALEGGE